MKIHFVCEGNTYRSRLAEAYANSLGLPGWEFSSSGVRASAGQNGPISWAAALALKQAGLAPFLPNRGWVETTAALVGEADVVVFMEERFQVFCAEKLGATPRRAVTWQVADVPEPALRDEARTRETLDVARRTLAQVSANVDELVRSLA